MKVCVITGGSSGIGKYTAIELVRRGYTVYALSRHAGDAAGVRYLTADVTRDADIRAAVDTVLRECGRIDLLINNAGFGISGAIEFTDTDAAIRQFDVNFFGAVRMCRAVLPILREQGGRSHRQHRLGCRRGCNPVSGILFRRKIRAVRLYAGTGKRGAPFGITAICMQPGDIRTGFTAAREKECLATTSTAGGSHARLPVWNVTNKTACPRRLPQNTSPKLPTAGTKSPCAPSDSPTNSSACWQSCSPCAQSTVLSVCFTQNKKGRQRFCRTLQLQPHQEQRLPSGRARTETERVSARTP